MINKACTYPFFISVEAGNIECNLHVPEDNTMPIIGISLICHPHPLYGGTMDNKIVQTMIRATTELGYIAVRFNFRGVGASDGAHDNGVGETIDALKVLHYMQYDMGYSLLQKLDLKLIFSNKNINITNLLDLPLILGGFSFGTFICANMQEYLQKPALRMLMIGTAAGKWDIKAVPDTSVIVHGNNDDVIPLNDTMDWAIKNSLPLIVVPQAGHFFHGKLIMLKHIIKQNLMYSYL
jgi:uncharacterized protein